MIRSATARPRPRPARLARAAGLALGAGTAAWAALAAAEAPEPAKVVAAYADVAMAVYNDALDAARDLDAAIDALLDDPSEATLGAAREAWVAARVPYQQTEVYRFGNELVDAWEGRVNAWPLDEGLIDYVDASYGTDSDENDFYAANVVANETLAVGGRTVDARQITPEFLEEELQEAGGIESNVATGYHAIEFLLWGQDLNGSNPGAGERPATDYDVENCTHGHCERRGEYLAAAAELLVDDLEEMASAWQDGGRARAALVGKGERGALAAMLTGMGSLSYGELAGERMQLGLMLHDPEEEHDCFADNTAASHYWDGVGIRNVWQGRYERPDGEVVEGPSLEALVAAEDPALARELSGELDASVEALGRLLESQREGRAYDQLIAEGDEAGNALVQTAIDALVAQTRNIERAVAALGLSGVELEGSDSLDDPSAVFQ